MLEMTHNCLDFKRMMAKFILWVHQSRQFHFAAECVCWKNSHTIFYIVILLFMNLKKNGNVGSFFEVINRWTDALGAGLTVYCKKRFSLFENDKIHFAFVRIP